VSASSLPAFCGGGEGFADVGTMATKALKALKLTHQSVWVRAGHVVLVPECWLL
jgi:hypothetical protein